MKKIINPYFIALFKENILYVGLNLILCLIIILFFSFNIKRISQNKEKISTLINENKDLEYRVSLLNNYDLSPEDIETKIKILNRLLPNSEDYFSIIYALDRLSQKTNFNISSYTVNLKASSQNKLRLLITGSGDKDAFLKFLNEYNFGGGRLITSDKMELNPQLSGQIKLNITFYTQKNTPVKNQTLKPVNATLLEELASLERKIDFNLKDVHEEKQNEFNYPRKTNPF